MAENEGATAVAEEVNYQIKIEDAGPATKKVHVEIPAERIAAKLAENFKELRVKAALPGFRVGHAPAKLLQKRFGNDVKEDVRRALISESYQQAIDKNKLEVLGEPEFENPDAIKLPEEGSALNYSFSIEVQPQFTLPELKGIKIKKPKIEVKEENVDQALLNLREQQGTLIPVEDRGVAEKDYLTADLSVKLGEKELTKQADANLVARPGRIAGIQVDDLAVKLEGAKTGETRQFTIKAPEDHPNEEIKGHELSVEVIVKDIKRLELVEVTPEFLQDLGFTDVAELREALKEQMVDRITADVQQNMRDQVVKFLNDSLTFDLPDKLSNRQADRVLHRRALDLLQRGIPEDTLKANLETLKTGAKDQAQREMKNFFILQKLAGDQGTEVDEPELNGRVATMAAMRGIRPEVLKQEMSKDGTLQDLYLQMREQKAVDIVLKNAEIEEVDVIANEQKA